MSRFVAMLAHVIRFERGGDEPMFPTRDNDPVPLAHLVRRAEAFASTYVIAAAARNPGEWTVYNFPLNRNVAAGLTRNQAVTLAQVLNLACPQRPNVRTDTTLRKEL
jgi:hypothetical protein